MPWTAKQVTHITIFLLFEKENVPESFVRCFNEDFMQYT